MVQRAFDHLRKFPLNGFTGMPGESDITATITQLQAQDAEELKLARDAKQQEEFAQLQKRRDEHPEEFFGLGDVLKKFTADNPGIELAPDREGVPSLAKPMPEVKALSDSEFNERQNILQQQAAMLLRNQV